MANIKTIIEDWEVKDRIDDPAIRIQVTHHTEMGNFSMPGIRVICADSLVDYEPILTEHWAYSAKRLGLTEYLLEYLSWKECNDTYIKFYLLTGDTLKAKVAVKLQGQDTPIVREYELPFNLAS